jgi:hypothetical protein
MKRIEWMTLPQWLALTPEQHHRLVIYLQKQNAELGIDVDGWHTGGAQLQFEKDDAEYEEKMSLGGQPYKRPR